MGMDDKILFQIKEKFGRLDVLVNNAGMVRPAGKLSEIPLDVYHDTINVNQNGAWYTLKLVSPRKAFLFSIVFFITFLAKPFKGWSLIYGKQTRKVRSRMYV